MKTILIVICFLSASCQGGNLKSKNSKEDFMPSYKEQLSNNSGKKNFTEFYDSTSNIYSNYQYGFSMKFPSNWAVDKGFSEHTIIRGLEKDSAITFSINVIEIKDGANDKFSIWKYFDSNREFVETQFKREMESSLQSAITEYSVKKIYFDNHETLTREFVYNVKHQDFEYQMKACMYQIAKPPFLFTLGLHIPLVFFDENPTRYNSIFNNFYFNPRKKY